MPITLPGCFLNLSHVSLKVALVNKHELLNWSFCSFVYQLPLFSLHLFSALLNASPRLPRFW